MFSFYFRSSKIIWCFHTEILSQSSILHASPQLVVKEASVQSPWYFSCFLPCILFLLPPCILLSIVRNLLLIKLEKFSYFFNFHSKKKKNVHQLNQTKHSGILIDWIKKLYIFSLFVFFDPFFSQLFSWEEKSVLYISLANNLAAWKITYKWGGAKIESLILSNIRN